MEPQYLQRLSEAQEVTEKLMNAECFWFNDLKPSQLPDRVAAVYAIFDRTDGSCLYVGRTKNIRRRMYTNHLMGPATNARLKKYLSLDDKRPDIPTMEAAKQYLIDNCYFQYIAVPDMRERGQAEGLLSYILDVRYIHEEH